MHKAHSAKPILQTPVGNHPAQSLTQSQSSDGLLDQEIAQLEALKKNCPHHLGNQLLSQIKTDLSLLEKKKALVDIDICESAQEIIASTDVAGNQVAIKNLL